MAFGKSSGITPYLLFLVGATVLGPLQFGYHLTELNTPSEAIKCQASSKKLTDYLNYWRPAGGKESERHGLPECIPMSPAEFGLVSSIYTLGGLIGALCAGPLSSRKGRLFPMRLAFPFFLIGSLMEALAPSLPAMALGRFFAGVGAGSCLVVGPVYIAEIAPPGTRGTLGAMTQIATNFGILGAQILGYFYSYGNMWRVILGVGAALGVVHFLGMLFGIESPQWLGSKGKPIAAKRALYKIRAGAPVEEEAARFSSIDEDDVEPYRDPRNSPDHISEGSTLLAQSSSSSKSSRDPSESIGMFEVLRDPDHSKAIVAVIAVMASQQFCGINSVMMYSVYFMKTLLPTSADLITISVGCLNVVVTILCAPLADKVGRKVALLLSIAGMCSMSFLLAFGIMYGVPVLVTVATLLFVASFAVGLGPVPFILASELVPPQAVGAAQSWALASSWISTFVVAQFFPMLNDSMGKGRVFFVFTGLALAFFLFIAWRVPESKGKASADEVWGRMERRDD